MKKIIAVIFCIMACSELWAHPVIWKNGWAMNYQVSYFGNAFKLHHSLSHRWALGLHTLSQKEEEYAMLQSNVLLKRWNDVGSQANLYVFTGLGAGLQRPSTEIGHLGFQADWETRRLYTQFSAHAYFKEQSHYQSRTRLGYSPYLVEYEGLSTWLILQLDTYHAANKHISTVMPVLRFFKDTMLLEVGHTFSDHFLITLMYHF